MFPIYAVPLTLHRFLSKHGKKMKPVPFPPPLCIMPAHFISFSIHLAKAKHPCCALHCERCAAET